MWGVIINHLYSKNNQKTAQRTLITLITTFYEQNSEDSKVIIKKYVKFLEKVSTFFKKDIFEDLASETSTIENEIKKSNARDDRFYTLHGLIWGIILSQSLFQQPENFENVNLIMNKAVTS